MKDIKVNISDKIINEFGEDSIKTLIEFIRLNDKDKSGNLVNSLDYRIRKTGEDIQLILEGEDYLKYISEGRNSGSFPPIQAIEEWTSLVGIPSYAAFPIAYNIFKYGIEPTNILTDSVVSIEELGTNNLEEDISNNLEEIIIKQIDKINDNNK